MSFKNKILIISIVLIAIIIVVTIIFLKNYEYEAEFDYDLAKNEAIHFLDKNISRLKEISKDCLLKKNKETYKFKNKEYCYIEEDEKSYVLIEVNSQGMLGGQYWYLIYCENDFLNGKTINIYDENKETGEGNNIFIVEKIKDNWYFFCEDWDGKVDVTKILVDKDYSESNVGRKEDTLNISGERNEEKNNYVISKLENNKRIYKYSKAEGDIKSDFDDKYEYSYSYLKYIVLNKYSIYFSSNLSDKFLEGTYSIDSKNEINYNFYSQGEDNQFFKSASYRFETINGHKYIVIDGDDYGKVYYEEVD